MLGVTIVDGTAANITESLEVIALGARAELDTFIARIVPIRAISRRMLRSRTFGYVTAALPGSKHSCYSSGSESWPATRRSRIVTW